jgi:transcriptional regulator GlxA family with amidase domain
MNSPDHAPLLAQIVLFDGFDPLDALAPFEILHAAGSACGGRLRVELASAEGARMVPSGLGLGLPAAAAIAPDRVRLLIVPGAAGAVGADGDDAIPVILGRALGTALPTALQAAAARPGAILAAVCGGSLVLGLAGLLHGRPAVTHHLAMEALAATGALPVAARVVDDGDRVTAGGVTSGLDLGLHLVERLVGPRIAHAVERLFEYERRGIVWRAAGAEPAPL